MTTKNLTYRRSDAVVGVGFFIPFAGKYVHSIAWPDVPAERYTVERLERMGIAVEGMETIGQPEREYLQSEHGWQFLTEEEAAEAQANVAQQLGVDPTEFFATGPELTGNELEAAKAEHQQAETPSDETSQETGGEASKPQNTETNAPAADVDPDNGAAANAETEEAGAGDGGNETELVDESAGTDETATDADEAGNDATETPAGEVTEHEADAPVVSEAQAIRDYLAEHPDASNKAVVAALKANGIEVSSGQVSREKRR